VYDKKKETPTPGWMYYMRKNISNDIAYVKSFKYDGSIEEGDMNKRKLINGFRWELKDDKSHDKYKVTNEKEDSFISNEMLY
jgi:thiamine pyrophosphokinase